MDPIREIARDQSLPTKPFRACSPVEEGLKRMLAGKLVPARLTGARTARITGAPSHAIPNAPQAEIAEALPRTNARPSGHTDPVRAGRAAFLGACRRIGRLRELTFRAAGRGRPEGHDRAYYTCLLWDREPICFVGAYRMGLADEISRTSWNCAAVYAIALQVAAEI